LPFQECLLALRARQRLGLARPRLSGRKALMLRDRVIDRELPKDVGGLEQLEREEPLGPTEHAMLEAAIQLDLITLRQAEALVEKGKTVGEWLVEHGKAEAGKARKVKLRMLDVLSVLALLLFNFAVLGGFGWIVLRVLRSL